MNKSHLLHRWEVITTKNQFVELQIFIQARNINIVCQKGMKLGQFILNIFAIHIYP